MVWVEGWNLRPPLRLGESSAANPISTTPRRATEPLTIRFPRSPLQLTTRFHHGRRGDGDTSTSPLVDIGDELRDVGDELRDVESSSLSDVKGSVEVGEVGEELESELFWYSM